MSPYAPKWALRRLYELAIKSHLTCDDDYYSCPKAIGRSVNDHYEDDECSCGADEHNAAVGEVWEALKCRM